MNIIFFVQTLNIDDKEKLSVTEKQATVRQLMQARSGVYLSAAYETHEMASSHPARGSFNPGEHWYYNNWDFNALGTIFQKFTGKTVFESLRDDLAVPLQFEDFRYPSDTTFRYESISEYPAYLMRLSARDLARVGLLMSRNGRWRGSQIVSEKWIAESTTSYSDTNIPDIGYGYMWYVDLRHKSFSARGDKGQVMIVNPVRDLVIVHKVNTENNANRNASGKQFSELLQLIMEAKSIKG